MKIVLCASLHFYQHVADIAQQLTINGHEAVLPHSAIEMIRTGSFDVSQYAQDDSPESVQRKRDLMDRHFKKIADGDAILVVNDEKHGVQGYIGANVLMEMAVAYYLGKKIFVLNNVGKENKAYDEVVGLGTVQLGSGIGALNKKDLAPEERA